MGCAQNIKNVSVEPRRIIRSEIVAARRIFYSEMPVYIPGSIFKTYGNEFSASASVH